MKKRAETVGPERSSGLPDAAAAPEASGPTLTAGTAELATAASATFGSETSPGRRLPVSDAVLEAHARMGIGLAVWQGRRYLFVNPPYAAMLGYSAEELLALDDVTRLIPSEGLEAAEQRLRERLEGGGATDLVELTLTHKSGRPVVVEVSTVGVDDEEGRRFVSLFRDITTRKQDEKARRDARAALEERVAERTRDLAEANERLKELDKLKSEFLAIMSHELRTPLNSILGFGTLILDELPGPLNDEQRRQMQQILDSGNHLLDLINDVLDIAKIEAGQAFVHLEEASVAAIVQGVAESLRPMADRKGLALDVSALSGLPHLLTDVRKVRQIVLNLLNNAIKFTSRGGVKVTASWAERAVALTFEDSGIGIRKHDLTRLFRPFQQLDSSARRSYEGTGLGLYLSQKMANLLGGDITVESVWQKGSRFTLTLPVLSPT
jgi:PAS domain S-box-containing protein